MNLKAIRKSRGLTLRELGRRCNLSAAFLCDIEQGYRKAAPDTVLKLARELNANVIEVKIDCKKCSGSGKISVLDLG